MSTSLNYWWAAYLRLIALWLLFLAVYCGCSWATSGRSDVGVVRFEWERSIPFVSWMIVPYLSIGVLFVAIPFAGLGRRVIDVFFWRMAAATIVAGACFLVFPLQLAGPRPSAPDFFGGIYELLKAADAPYNLFPSLHVAYLLIMWTTYNRRMSILPAALLHVWFGLVLVSVLFVHQHHFIDMVGGAALAIVCITVVPTAFRKRSTA